MTVEERLEALEARTAKIEAAEGADFARSITLEFVIGFILAVSLHNTCPDLDDALSVCDALERDLVKINADLASSTLSADARASGELSGKTALKHARQNQTFMFGKNPPFASVVGKELAVVRRQVMELQVTLGVALLAKSASAPWANDR